MKRWLLALCCLWLVPTASAFSTDTRIDAIASHFAGRPVSVQCLTLWESQNDPQMVVWGASAYVEGFYVGDVWRPYDVARMKVGICERLQALMDGDASRWSARSLAWAILVLTHETGHLKDARWSGDEAKTECWAIKHVQAFGYRLGLRGEGLTILQWLANEQHRKLPEQYQSNCQLPTAWA